MSGARYAPPGVTHAPPGTRERMSGALPAARGDPVRVEYGVDVAQAADRLIQCPGVRDLDDEAVLDHRVVHRTPRLEDVDAGLRERARHVLEQPVAVPAVDLELDSERGLGVAVPRDGREPVGILL